jgi:hypothetical protein
VDAREDDLRSRRPDVDADAFQDHIVLDPDRVILERAKFAEIVMVVIGIRTMLVRFDRAEGVVFHPVNPGGSLVVSSHETPSSCHVPICGTSVQFRVLSQSAGTHCQSREQARVG